MTVRCNICQKDIEEGSVEPHIVSQDHMENKSKMITNSNGSNKSVAKLWLESS